MKKDKKKIKIVIFKTRKLDFFPHGFLKSNADRFPNKRQRFQIRIWFADFLFTIGRSRMDVSSPESNCYVDFRF